VKELAPLFEKCRDVDLDGVANLSWAGSVTFKESYLYRDNLMIFLQVS